MAPAGDRTKRKRKKKRKEKGRKGEGEDFPCIYLDAD